MTSRTHRARDAFGTSLAASARMTSIASAFAQGLRSGRILFVCLAITGCRAAEPAAEKNELPLPVPRTTSSVALETALAKRKPTHIFGPGEVSLADVSQLLWATRATPTMGAIPLDLYVAQSTGVIRYSPGAHTAAVVVPYDVRKAIAQASGEPEDVRNAPVLFVFVARTAQGHAKYGPRADRFAAIEAGHAAQSTLLQATALGLSASPLALFDENAIREALLLPKDHLPIHLVAVGQAQ